MKMGVGYDKVMKRTNFVSLTKKNETFGSLDTLDLDSLQHITTSKGMYT